MSESLNIPQGSKADIYEALLPQIEAVISAETDPIANLANTAACLHEAFHFWWTGFYRVLPKAGMTRANDIDPSATQELVLGPFQGPLACTRIRYGRGVCGTAWKEARTLIVPDVDQFPGHIACSSASRSEIVVPIFKEAEVIAVLDIDSEHLATFDEVDQHYLEQLSALLSARL